MKKSRFKKVIDMEMEGFEDTVRKPVRRMSAGHNSRPTPEKSEKTIDDHRKDLDKIVRKKGLSEIIREY